jgi:hypothetical protein
MDAVTAILVVTAPSECLSFMNFCSCRLKVMKPKILEHEISVLGWYNEEEHGEKQWCSTIVTWITISRFSFFFFVCFRRCISSTPHSSRHQCKMTSQYITTCTSIWSWIVTLGHFCSKSCDYILTTGLNIPITGTYLYFYSHAINRNYKPNKRNTVYGEHFSPKIVGSAIW